MTAPSRVSGAPAEARDYAVLRWLVLATFVVILNETLMVNALPTLQAEFGVTARAAQWLTSAFMLTMAVVIPVTGWFLQRVTTRRAFTTAMAVFCSGTLLAAVAPTFELLLLGRIVQASGTAVMMPLLMTTLMTVVHEQDRGRIMGNVTLAISVAPALGPAVSGLILEVASWRWMFGLVLPIALAISVVGLRRLTDVGETVAAPIDWFSVALSVVGFGPFVYGLSQLGAPEPPVSPVLMVLVGVGAITAFVLRQLALQRRGTPLLDLRTLRIRTFSLATALMSVGFMAMIGSMILVPIYAQGVLGLSQLETGLLMMPGGLAMGLLGPQVGRVFDRYGSRPLLIPGALAILIGLGALTRIGAETSYWLVLGPHVLLMVGLAAVFTPSFTLGLGSLPPHLYSHGSSVLGTAQQVAGGIGAAVVITVADSRKDALLGRGVAELDAIVGGLQWGFTVGAVLAIAVVALAAFLPARTPQQPAPDGLDLPEAGHLAGHPADQDAVSG